MAISYDLEMATASAMTRFAGEPRAAGQSIGLFGTSVTVEQPLSDGLTTRLGTWLQVYDASLPQPYPQP